MRLNKTTAKAAQNPLRIECLSSALPMIEVTEGTTAGREAIAGCHLVYSVS
ncbi:MAG: hypothetical protein AAGG53_12435 [Cyanobacteria bacterium P01_H01_bin.152]